MGHHMDMIEALENQIKAATAAKNWQLVATLANRLNAICAI